jgi:membrane-anchored glycerophosphoryl diester phosphodiesterase (GDPDase)
MSLIALHRENNFIRRKLSINQRLRDCLTCVKISGGSCYFCMVLNEDGSRLPVVLSTFTITKKLIFLLLGGHNEDLFSIIMLRFGGHVLLCPRYQPPLAKMSRKSNRKIAQTFVCFMFSLNIFSFAIKKHRSGDF